MNRLFGRLRGHQDRTAPGDALPGFDDRLAILMHHAQNARQYEDDLLGVRADLIGQLQRCESRLESLIDQGADRDALEYIRLAARLRPQYELVDRELRAFGAVAEALIVRLDVLLQHTDQARVLTRSARANPQATAALDHTLDRLTRHFILLDRVATARRADLPTRLVMLMTHVLDDRQLDLMLATYILNRRRALAAAERAALPDRGSR